MPFYNIGNVLHKLKAIVFKEGYAKWNSSSFYFEKTGLPVLTSRENSKQLFKIL